MIRAKLRGACAPEIRTRPAPRVIPAPGRRRSRPYKSIRIRAKHGLNICACVPIDMWYCDRMKRHGACSLREGGPYFGRPTPLQFGPTGDECEVAEQTQVVDFRGFSGFFSWFLRRPFAVRVQLSKARKQLMQVVDFHDSFRYFQGLRCFRWNAKWKLGLAAALTNPERIEAFSPALRGTSYAGFQRPGRQYPERVTSDAISTCSSTPSGLRNLKAVPQGRPSRSRANPGLNDAILSGLRDWPWMQIAKQFFLFNRKQRETYFCIPLGRCMAECIAGQPVGKARK